MAHIGRAVYIPNALYHYRKESCSFTSRHNPRLPQQWDNLYQEIKNLLATQQVGNEFQEAFHNRISLGIIGLGLNELFAQSSFQDIFNRIDTLCNVLFVKSHQFTKNSIYAITLEDLLLFAKWHFTTGVTLLLMIIKIIILRMK